MTIGCGGCRARLAARVAGHSSEADAIEVEEHLQDCEACRAEHARWAVVATLKNYEPELSPKARDRVVSQLVDRAIAGGAPVRERARPRSLVGPMLALSFAAAVAVLLVSRSIAVAPARVLSGDVLVRGKPASPGARIDDGASLVSTRGGAILLDGPRVDLGAGTKLRWRRGERTVDLDDGQIEVDVVPGQGQRFRIATTRFIVEVVGTHFTVTPGSVATEHGTVRVLDRGEREIRLVRAGERWSIDDDAAVTERSVVAAKPAGAPPGGSTSTLVETPPATSTVVPPAATPNAPPAAREPAPTAPLADATPSRSSPDKDSAASRHSSGHSRGASSRRGDEPGILDEARAALADGQSRLARELLRATLAADTVPLHADAAEARLLFAESFLVEKRHREAIRAYHEVARRYPGSPQAESALFAAAELQLESGRPEEARRGLEDYLRRYPQGRYQAEAAAKLARLGRP